MQLETVVAAQNTLGEGPVWNDREGALYWVDIEGRLLQRYSPGSGAYEKFQLNVKVGCFAFRETGGLVLAGDAGLAFWKPFGPLEPIAHPEAGKPAARFNDGKVDRAGRFWAGTMTPEGDTSALYRLDPDLSLKTMLTGVTISNGLGWSPDDRTLYHADTQRHTVFAYDFDLATGEIAGKRAFLQVPEAEGVPDGLCVDAGGFLWVALWGGWKVIRVSPAGKVVNEVRLPVSLVTSCTFGGEDWEDLYITSASVDFDEAKRKAQPQAGGLFHLRPGVQGLPTNHFMG